MRSLLLAAILSAGVTALCQPGPDGSTRSGSVEEKPQACGASNGFANLPSAWRATDPALPTANLKCDLPTQWRWNTRPIKQGQTFDRFKADFQTRLWDSTLAMNDSSIFRVPADRQPKAKAEPIPTQWPNAKVEQIPTQWPGIKLQPVDSQSGSRPGASGAPQTPDQ